MDTSRSFFCTFSAVPSLVRCFFSKIFFTRLVFTHDREKRPGFGPGSDYVRQLPLYHCCTLLLITIDDGPFVALLLDLFMLASN